MFEIGEFKEGTKYELWVMERINGKVGKSLLHTLVRYGDMLNDIECDMKYTIDELNESLKYGMLWSKKEYKNYAVISYNLVVIP